MKAGSEAALARTSQSVDSDDGEDWTKGDMETELSLNGAWARVGKEDGKLEWTGGDLHQTSVQGLNQGTVGMVMQVKLPGERLIRFAYCPPGSFKMGSPKHEEERHFDEDQVAVQITTGFWMGQYEVTQGQWEVVMGSNPSYFRGAELPVECVSWEDAQAFIRKLNQFLPLPTGWQYALPTEAQWEYACRAGTETVFHFGDTLNGTEANCDPDLPYGTQIRGPFLGKTSAVGSYPPNAWALYDMHGNVTEWCADWYGEQLIGGTDPSGPASGYYRTVRGGSWPWIGKYCRAAKRTSFARQEDEGIDHGFRVVVVPTS